MSFETIKSTVFLVYLTTHVKALSFFSHSQGTQSLCRELDVSENGPVFKHELISYSLNKIYPFKAEQWGVIGLAYMGPKNSGFDCLLQPSNRKLTELYICNEKNFPSHSRTLVFYMQKQSSSKQEPCLPLCKSLHSSSLLMKPRSLELLLRRPLSL